MNKVLILDTETTGVSKKDQVIELAYLELTSLQNEMLVLDAFVKYNLFHGYIPTSLSYTINQRYKPSCPIHERAFEVHGIGEIQLVACPKANTVNLPDNIEYIIGHNISFDKRMLEQTNPELKNKLDNAKYICTLALAKTNSKSSDVNYENHQLDTLAKHYYPDYADTLVTLFHSASLDVLKTLLVLLAMVKSFPALETYEDIYNFQKSLKGIK